VLFSALVIWYIFNIQMVDGAKWRALSDTQTLKYKIIQAVRGNIYSDDGTLLATSVPRYEMRMDLTILPLDTFNKYIPQLAALLSNKFKDQTYSDYLLDFENARRQNNRYFFIKRKLSFLDIKEIKLWPLYKKGRYKSGLIIEEENYRVMPFKNMLARTIGYSATGKDKQRVGLEGAFNTELAGVTGKRLVQKISGGFRPVNDNNELEPVDGKDVYTTINVNIQDIVNNALFTGLTKHQAHHGSAILMEVKTGEIKAIANLTLSPDGTYKETFNYAVGESFEPGSTFKLVSALALLNNSKIAIDDSVFINYGSCEIKGKTMLDAETSPFKNQTFAYAFEHSSNVGISTTMMQAFKDEPKAFSNYIKELKLDKPLGLEIPGEGVPLIKEPGKKSWTRITLPWMSIGYEVKCTPLQLLSVYNAVANDGLMLKPFLVKAVGQKGEIEKKFKPVTLNEKIADNNTLSKVKDLLKNVVVRGTGSTIRDCRIPVSGKTGTARISDGTGYAEGDYYSSFAGYFPSDKPVYSIIVVINKPRVGGYFGGVVAGPIVKEIAEKVLGIQTLNGNQLPDSLEDAGTFPYVLAGQNKRATSFLERYTNYDLETTGENSDWIFAKKDSTGKYIYSVNNPGAETMPNLEGMGLRDAIYILENKKLKVKSEGKGRIYWQSVNAGNKVVKGSTVLIKLKV
jgi:cell division protein FtsI (penicillin-binding protein 3)